VKMRELGVIAADERFDRVAERMTGRRAYVDDGVDDQPRVP
jgi:hypothetical protein